MTRPSTVPERLLLAIAERQHRDPTDLPPLSDAVDPDALRKLTADDHRPAVTIAFNYAGYHVSVTDDTITLEARGSPTDATA